MKRFLVPAAVLVAAAGIGVPSAASSPRIGILHAAKECSEYTGAAGSFCTITASNISAIKVGSRVVYASPMLDPTGIFKSDLVIDGPGNNTAYGHVVIDNSIPAGPIPVGYITFSGGTGVFKHFHAVVVVRCSTLIDCTWDGLYSFSPKGD